MGQSLTQKNPLSYSVWPLILFITRGHLFDLEQCKWPLLHYWWAVRASVRPNMFTLFARQMTLCVNFFFPDHFVRLRP